MKLCNWTCWHSCCTNVIGNLLYKLQIIQKLNLDHLLQSFVMMSTRAPGWGSQCSSNHKCEVQSEASELALALQILFSPAVLGPYKGTKKCQAKKEERMRNEGNDAFANGACHAGSHGVMALWGSRPCHVSRCGRHSGYRARETQNPREVQKCRKRRLNVKCCLLTLRAAQCDDRDFYFFLPFLHSAFAFWFCASARCQLWVGSFCHLILRRWHICRDLTHSGLVILWKRGTTSTSSLSSSSTCILSILHIYPSLLCFVSLSQSSALSLWCKRIIYASQ